MYTWVPCNHVLLRFFLVEENVCSSYKVNTMAAGDMATQETMVS